MLPSGPLLSRFDAVSPQQHEIVQRSAPARGGSPSLGYVLQSEVD